MPPSEIPIPQDNKREFGKPSPMGEDVRPKTSLWKQKEAIRGFGDITSEDRKILDQDIFKSGEKVRVRRTSGEIEDGWEVMSVNEESKMVLLGKKDIDAVKRVELPKLLALNEPQFDAGEKVKVARTSGRVEDGWEVVSYSSADPDDPSKHEMKPAIDQATQRVGVRKGAISKWIKVEELAALNKKV